MFVIPSPATIRPRGHLPLYLSACKRSGPHCHPLRGLLLLALLHPIPLLFTRPRSPLMKQRQEVEVSRRQGADLVEEEAAVVEAGWPVRRARKLPSPPVVLINWKEMASILLRILSQLRASLLEVLFESFGCCVMMISFPPPHTHTHCCALFELLLPGRGRGGARPPNPSSPRPPLVIRTPSVTSSGDAPPSARTQQGRREASGLAASSSEQAPSADAAPSPRSVRGGHQRGRGGH